MFITFYLKGTHMITIQELAAFCALLTRAGEQSVWSVGCDVERIESTFNARHLLHLEIGGLDYTPELIQLYIATVPYIRNNVIPPDAVLANHGFYGAYMGWFWRKVTEIGETTFFSLPVGHFKKELIAQLDEPNVTDGWKICFIEGALHEMYQQCLRGRVDVAKVLKMDPITKPVWPFLRSFK